jgi:3-phenylpropionate/trans-cinnamate dioxygenase ferredoxin component
MSSVVLGEDFVQIARVDDLQDGMMKGFTIKGLEILVARVQDQYYAVTNICPHMGEKLTRGKLEGTVITCPRNDSKFDLIDGRIIRWTDWTGIRASVSKLFRSPRPLITYPIKVEGDNILIQL